MCVYVYIYIIIYIYNYFKKTNPQQRGSESFHVGEHIKVPGGWCIQREGGSLVSLLIHLTLCIFPMKLLLSCILYSKLVKESKALALSSMSCSMSKLVNLERRQRNPNLQSIGQKYWGPRLGIGI
uniref:Uncharacterized protein n=1 Tax=Pipistrellus kuhlii TaxID=59472 RepID=A0A7J8A932_PIPKU|nr:hypothetical protein mPipKuh1_009020 [Pipistrellus kuhlii]